MQPITKDTLYYGDNLDILERYIPDESVDLIYLDPPFNSNRNYNVLFKEGKVDSTAQIHAFEDTWEWTPATIEVFTDLTHNNPNPHIAILINSLAEIVGHNPMMAYLVNMTARLLPLHRILKSTGSLYLHCDPTASHYLKIILDGIFGTDQFRNEIVWKRTFAHGSAKRYGPVHDIILFYSKSDDFLWTHFRQAANDEYLEEHFKLIDPTSRRRFQPISLTGAGIRTGESGKPWRGINPTDIGRHWALPGRVVEHLGIHAQTTQEKLDALDQAGLIYWPQKEGGTPRLKHFADEVTGVALPDIWVDIPPISSHAAERLGYPTQKPEALLERIIAASSNEGDWILDPFCGCGTAVAVAQRLNRHWIGIDISIQAIKVIKQRLQHHYPGIQVPTDGIPRDYESACALSEKDKMRFQDWAISLVDAYAPGGVTKRGADRGIDGLILFYERPEFQKPSTTLRKILVQVKGGGRERRDIATLKGDMERENAPMGVLITLHDPTSEMKREAALAGEYRYSDTKVFPKVQILSMKEWFQGKNVQLPSSTVNPFKMAEVKADQKHLFPLQAG